MTEFFNVQYVDADDFTRVQGDIDFSTATGIASRAASSYFTVKDACEDTWRDYKGLNTALMLITPAYTWFRQLVLMSRHGRWLPYTNTEQDVIESMMMPDNWGYMHGDGQSKCDGTPQGDDGLAADKKAPAPY